MCAIDTAAVAEWRKGRQAEWVRCCWIETSRGVVPFVRSPILAHSHCRIGWMDVFARLPQPEATGRALGWVGLGWLVGIDVGSENDPCRRYDVTLMDGSGQPALASRGRGAPGRSGRPGRPGKPGRLYKWPWQRRIYASSHRAARRVESSRVESRRGRAQMRHRNRVASPPSPATVTTATMSQLGTVNRDGMMVLLCYYYCWLLHFSPGCCTCTNLLQAARTRGTPGAASSRTR
jgi:hypothetical protein